MRRKEKAVKELADIESIIGAASYFTLGLVDGAETYMVPLDFGYSSDGQNLGSVYFHCARSGRKLELINANPQVSLLFVAAGHALIDEGDGSMACTLNTDYRSVMALGEARVVESNTEKLSAMRVVLRQHGCEHLPMDPDNLDKTTLVRIDLKEAVGKAYKQRRS